MGPAPHRAPGRVRWARSQPRRRLRPLLPRLDRLWCGQPGGDLCKTSPPWGAFGGAKVVVGGEPLARSLQETVRAPPALWTAGCENGPRVPRREQQRRETAGWRVAGHGQGGLTPCALLPRLFCCLQSGLARVTRPPQAEDPSAVPRLRGVLHRPRCPPPPTGQPPRPCQDWPRRGQHGRHHASRHHHGG